MTPQVGLAVDDIKGIQEAAVLKRLALQVRSMTSSVFHLGRGIVPNLENFNL